MLQKSLDSEPHVISRATQQIHAYPTQYFVFVVSGRLFNCFRRLGF